MCLYTTVLCGQRHLSYFKITQFLQHFHNKKKRCNEDKHYTCTLCYLYESLHQNQYFPIRKIFVLFFIRTYSIILCLCEERPLCENEFYKFSSTHFSSSSLTIVMCNIFPCVSIANVCIATLFSVTNNSINQYS